MIEEACRTVFEEAGWEGGAAVEIRIPGGGELAKKTFNPMLGIEGGLSVLGTSGIVEPMSEKALVDTLEVTLRQVFREGHRRVILTPGNYGEDFLREQGWYDAGIPVVKFSNWLGEALDICAALGMEEVLLAGHIGKLVKAAGGIMNTHSKTADARMEILAAHAAAAGMETGAVREIMAAATTDAALDILDREGLLEPVMKSLVRAMQAHVSRRAGETVETGVITFSRVRGLLGMSGEAKELLSRLGLQLREKEG